MIPRVGNSKPIEDELPTLRIVDRNVLDLDAVGLESLEGVAEHVALLGVEHLQDALVLAVDLGCGIFTGQISYFISTI